MQEKNYFVGYIGTYTKKASEGIYRFILDTEAKEVKEIHLAAKIDNPTYLTISENKRWLYSVSKQGESGGIAAFSIQEDGTLKSVNQTLSEGASPCHVSIGPENYLLSANYHKGTVDLYKRNMDGSIQTALAIVKHNGSGPDPRQEHAHTHYAGFTPDKKFIVAVDLGMDQILTYEAKDEKLHEVTRFICKPGSGPRHIDFHPSQPYAYVMTEFSSEVIVLKYNSANGSFKHVQSISTLPESFKENNQGSAIYISKDGNFVYAGNRGHDSIAVFKINQETFELSLVEHTSTEGNWPRDFALDPSEQYLLASNQNSNTLTLFARNSDTGKLTLLQKNIEAPEPVCVKFLLN